MKARFHLVLMSMIACFMLLIGTILLDIGCGKNPSNSEETGPGMVIDIDGNVYQTVRIGDQEWMAENLKVTRFRNGEKIANAKEDIEWNDLETGAWCDFVNNPDLAEIYGHLYNWYAINDPRGLAPVGWRVPTDEDWKELEEYLGMSEIELDSIGLRGSGEGNSLKSDSGWNENKNGTNETDFSALPAGRRIHRGSFHDLGDCAVFWSSTEYSEKHAWYRCLYFSVGCIVRDYCVMEWGYSVRCLKDK